MHKDKDFDNTFTNIRLDTDGSPTNIRAETQGEYDEIDIHFGASYEVKKDLDESITTTLPNPFDTKA